MKICTKCKQEKDFICFTKRPNRPSGYVSQCKDCKNSYRIQNRAKLLVQNKIYRENNKEKLNAKSRDYNEKHRAGLSVYQKYYQQRNKAKICAISSKRRAAKLNATPKWLTKEQLQEIQDFYEIAAAFKLYTGQEYQVDHIIPLQSSEVCGLHVPWNLQILTAKENIIKSNKLI
jgi:hypothetical protein